MKSFGVLFALVALSDAAGILQLTNANWKKEVVDSPHGVFVNVCRQG